MLDTQTELHQTNRKLRLAKLGNGETVIFLHGYPENLQLFSDLAKLLSSEKEIVLFDWPGMGNSEDWPGGATPLLMAKHLLQLLDAWKIDKAHLIGQDMGGQPALVFAAQYPGRVLSVTVMNSLLYGEIKTSFDIKLLRKFKLNQFALNYFPSIVFHRAVSTFFYTSYKLSKELKDDFWFAFKQKSVRRFIIRMCAGYEAQIKKLPELYRKVKCPVLILWAQYDRHFPPAQAEHLHKELPHSKLYIIKQAGHWMVLEKPEEIAGELKAFYASLKN